MDKIYSKDNLEFTAAVVKECVLTTTAGYFTDLNNVNLGTEIFIELNPVDSNGNPYTSRMDWTLEDTTPKIVIQHYEGSNKTTTWKLSSLGAEIVENGTVESK